jgi:hypothetical protein
MKTTLIDGDTFEHRFRVGVLLLLALGLVMLFSQWVGEAFAADRPGIGCVQVGDDAGTTGFITIPTGNRELALRCEGYSARHRFGKGSGTVAASTDSILDADKTVPFCVDPENDTRVSFYKLYDGGNPQCCAYKVTPRDLPCNQP